MKTKSSISQCHRSHRYSGPNTFDHNDMIDRNDLVDADEVDEGDEGDEGDEVVDIQFGRQ